MERLRSVTIFRLEVKRPSNGLVIFKVIRVENRDLKHLPSLYGKVLDHMVEDLEGRLG